MAAYCIILAGIFDFLDGYVARASRTSSAFGTEYDSLSDVISFGVAPAVLFFCGFLRDLKEAGVIAVFIFIACAALRLARFNSKIEGDEKVAFRGLPSTAAAGFMASFFLFMNKYQLEFMVRLIPLIMFGIAFLMVSSFRYPAISAARLWRKKPFSHLGVLILLFGVIIFFFNELSFFVITFGYVILGIAHKLRKVKSLRHWYVLLRYGGSKNSSDHVDVHRKKLKKEGE